MDVYVEIIFFVCMLGALYSYFIYPCILLFLPKRPQKKSKKGDIYKSISLIITAHNEEHQIENKIRNSLNLQYAEGMLEIIVASDGSTDSTDHIVSKYADEGVKLIRVVDRKGKENAQLHAVRIAKGEVLVFSDVATIIPDDALTKLSSYFDDDIVGAVSSEDKVIGKDGAIEGEGAYVRYEMWVRKLESRVFSLVGLSGSFFACRKDVTQNWDVTVPSDFNTALNSVRRGMVAISAPDVLGYYKSISDSTKEYKRKYRTALRGMSALKSYPGALNPFNNALFAFEVISHKLMRWLVPWFIVVAFIANLYLSDKGLLYVVTFSTFIVFFIFSLLGYISRTLRRFHIFGIPFFFFQVNLALMIAGVDVLRGKSITTWAPSNR